MAADLGLGFPVAHSVTESDAATVGAWWSTHDSHGQHIQPCEMIIGRGGTVLASMYASGPVGRMSVDEVLTFVRNREHR